MLTDSPLLACENSRPSSLPARVAFREEGQLFSQATPLWFAAKFKELCHGFRLEKFNLNFSSSSFVIRVPLWSIIIYLIFFLS